jgi:protein TonB
MPNHESLREACYAPYPVSSSATLDNLYQGRGPIARPVKVSSPSSSQSRSRLKDNKALGPDAIWGQFNNYRSNGLMVSVLVHIALLGIILSGAIYGHQVVVQQVRHEHVILIAPPPDSYALQVAKKVVSGGGGGGDHDRLPAPKARLPKLAMQQITPPAIVVHNEQPKLAVQPAVVVPPQVRMADNHMPNLGNPMAAPLPAAPPSNGIGSGGGIGAGSGGGVGEGHGPGVGLGSGGGVGGGVFKVGGGISAPQPVSTPDPEYTEEARIAKTQGTCVLRLIVDEQGRPRDIRVIHGLGAGLDAKAIEAVQQWRFQPATKDGRPVNVQISVEVGFRLH